MLNPERNSVWNKRVRNPTVIQTWDKTRQHPYEFLFLNSKRSIPDPIINHLAYGNISEDEKKRIGKRMKEEYRMKHNSKCQMEDMNPKKEYYKEKFLQTIGSIIVSTSVIWIRIIER